MKKVKVYTSSGDFIAERAIRRHKGLTYVLISGEITEFNYDEDDLSKVYVVDKVIRTR